MEDELSYEERNDFQVDVQRSDPSLWGLSICTVDGQRYSLGKTIFTLTFLSVKRKDLDIKINYNQVMSTPSLLSNPVASRSRTPSVSRNLVQRSKMMNDLVNVPPSSLSSLSSSIQFSWPTIVPRLSTSTSGKSPVDATSTRSASTSQASEEIKAIRDRNLN